MCVYTYIYIYVYCVRIWYRRYGICAHLTERIDVDVVCPDKLDSGTQHQYPEQPLPANSVRRFSQQRYATSCLCSGNRSDRRQVTSPLARRQKSS